MREAGYGTRLTMDEMSRLIRKGAMAEKAEKEGAKGSDVPPTSLQQDDTVTVEDVTGTGTTSGGVPLAVPPSASGGAGSSTAVTVEEPSEGNEDPSVPGLPPPWGPVPEEPGRMRDQYGSPGVIVISSDEDEAAVEKDQADAPVANPILGRRRQSYGGPPTSGSRTEVDTSRVPGPNKRQKRN